MQMMHNTTTTQPSFLAGPRKRRRDTTLPCEPAPGWAEGNLRATALTPSRLDGLVAYLKSREHSYCPRVPAIRATCVKLVRLELEHGEVSEDAHMQLSEVLSWLRGGVESSARSHEDQGTMSNEMRSSLDGGMAECASLSSCESNEGEQREEDQSSAHRDGSERAAKRPCAMIFEQC
eukprot:TRINITY_DN33731_c0_g1_i2.p1 TRINITY_DN33731_c0_g1~~TRINITY_DN33731_c0_g1_i2.p1  ORF type:complete len:177 (+),score=24.67 TRINITY_DN33731_c0_g1_i2:249-779(+)